MQIYQAVQRYLGVDLVGGFQRQGARSTPHLVFNRLSEEEKKPEGGSEGFTLIELSVVIAIIALLTGVVMANYHQSRKTSLLRMSARELASDVRSAEGMAISTKKTFCPLVNATTTSYGVYVAASPANSYTLFADCNSSKKYDYGDVDIKNNNLKKGVDIVSTSPSPLNIVFIPPDPAVYISSDGFSFLPSSQITMESKTGGKTIIINKIGLIEVR